MLKRGLLKKYASLFSIMIKVSDIFLILIAFFSTYLLHIFLPLDQIHVYLLILVCLLCIIIFPIFSLYSSRRGMSVFDELSRLLLAWIMVWMCVFTMSVFSHSGHLISLHWILIFFSLGFCLLALERIFIRSLFVYFRKNGYNLRNVVILGAGKSGKKVVERLQSESWAGLIVTAVLDDNEKLRNTLIGNIKVMGGIDLLPTLLEKSDVDEVWITLPLSAEKRVRDIIGLSSQYSNLSIQFVPDIFSIDLLNHQVIEVAGISVLNLNHTPMEGWNRLIKAIEDRMIALFILVFITPILLGIALLIKFTSSGPVIFKQKRHGWDGKAFTIYKFRTMYCHQENDVKQAVKNDSRVTPIGRFLRKTSLDELPQFINVLQGRMSIVGPRPHAVEHNEKYKSLIGSYMLRHKVKPGITGWAQVNGWRGETETIEKMQKRLDHDLFYIRNWSLLLDLKIIFLTIFRGFINKNAY